MQWEVLSKADAKQITNTWQEMPKEKFDLMVKEWPLTIPQKLNDDYRKLRNDVVQAYASAKETVMSDSNIGAKKEYYTDLRFALNLYDVLEKYDFSLRMAANDQVWIYLCVKVFPDIVHNRYPGHKIKTESGIVQRNINEERFWKTRRRIYLKVLWWYVYLSLQFDEDGNVDINKTFDVLKDNSTDEIVQIVERSGAAGYRVDVYRYLMKYYANNRDRYDNKRFRQVMVLNTARTQIVEPLLMAGGIEEYIKELFEYFDE